MVRGVDDDFAALREYVASYSLQHFGTDVAATQNLKSAHKVYLPLLHLWAQTRLLSSKKELLIAGTPITASSPAFPHIKEAVSDIGSGLSCCVHGGYKAGHMCLRSSIENFLRFICGPYDAKAMTTKSIYDLFSVASTALPFAGSRKNYLNSLRDTYVQLCKYSHSASLKHMSGVEALSHFRTHHSSAFREWIKFANSIVDAMASIIVLECPNVYLGAHFKTKEILELIVPTPVRRTVLEGQFKKK